MITSRSGVIGKTTKNSKKNFLILKSHIEKTKKAIGENDEK
jgi:hypothetical protein